MQVKKGMIVKSKAGHDKERFYLVLEVKGPFAWIVDGKRRRFEKPKKKNVKHLQCTENQDQCNCKTNKSVRRLLQEWNTQRQGQ